MTNLEKQGIIRLKEEGKSYTAIASITGMNKSTIKSIYSRYLGTKRGEEKYCPVCGKVLVQTRGHRQKKYCSSKCKDIYWNNLKCGGSNE